RVISVIASLPDQLGDVRDNARVGEILQADPADPELPVHGARPPAAVAPRVEAYLELLRSGLFDAQRLLSHYCCSLRSPANGKPRPLSRARASSSVSAVVVIATSRPRTCWIES